MPNPHPNMSGINKHRAKKRESLAKKIIYCKFPSQKKLMMNRRYQNMDKKGLEKLLDSYLEVEEDFPPSTAQAKIATQLYINITKLEQKNALTEETNKDDSTITLILQQARDANKK